MQIFCAVTGCRNTSSKAKGIVLHKLPSVAERREAWLSVIPTQSKSKHLVVCSRHFREEDFSLPAGLTIIRRLKPDAVPSIFPSLEEIEAVLQHKRRYRSNFGEVKKFETDENSDELLEYGDDWPLNTNTDEDADAEAFEEDEEKTINQEEFGVQVEQADSYEMDSFNYTEITDSVEMEEQFDECNVAVCRLCLLQTDKLYHMDKHNLRVHYEELLNGPMPNESRMPQTLCSVCVRLLAKCVDFKQKCERAHQLLEELTNDGHQITEEKLNAIDRDKEGFVRLKMSLQLIDEIVDVKDPSKDDSEDKSKAGASFVNLVAIANDQVFVNDINQSEIKKEVIDEELFNTVEPQIEYDDNIGDNLYVEKTEVVVSESPKKQQKLKKKPPVAASTVEGVKPLDPNNWEVLTASEEEIIEGIENRKNSEMFKMAAYKCHLCFRGFLNQEAFENHMFFHSQDRGEFECEYCRLRFAKESFKRTHVSRQHHYSYRCRRCHYRCTTSHNAHRHDQDHEGVVYPCDVCSLDFRKYTAYMAHKRVHHRSAHVCPGCGENFPSQLACLQHFRRMHPYLEWPEAARAGGDETSGGEGGGAGAGTGTGSGDDPLYCEKCDMRFLGPEAFNMHFLMSTNHADVQGNCTRVSAFSSRKTGPRHKTNAPIKTDCPLCNKTFASNVAYIRHHKQEHAGLPPAGRYMCETCGRKYVSNFQLEHHRLQHTGILPYACQLCPRRFNLKSNLVRHTRSHTGVRLFGCEECGKRFTTKADVETHVKHVHRRIPWPKRYRNRAAPPPAPGAAPPNPRQGPRMRTQQHPDYVLLYSHDSPNSDDSN